ncbi:Uncharacterized conserved protein [Peptoclostridium litorale DSM 5388]|uniref:S-layer domain-containing protein n=1 Tax=Peptoclostridium litorale DSM 5388 TaxID=1121324 RepID=A0A069RCF2_PEPLI|nr:CARDB domain-containing protein [Peptoclostridium litorale]KDR94724.1 S-layer domain-containing protein [Peptoclostridium litorale DSM 5388]SIO33164.1 Uncharacterized conserved protein [Peptoclostridium litorale DSM 5388]
MRKSRNITAIIMIVIMALMQAGYSYAGGTENYDPRITVKTDKMVEASAGQKVKFGMTVGNDTPDTSKNIEIEPVINDKFPFEINTSTVKKTLSRVGRYSSEKIEYEFLVPAAVKTGTYPIEFTVEYENFYSDKFKTTQTVYVKVVNDKIEPILSVSKTEFGGKKLSAGQASDVKFYIKNTGSFNAKKIYATISGFESEGLTMSGSNTATIDNIKPGEEKAVSFKITPYEDIKSGNYDLAMKLDYVDENSQSYSRESKVFLPVIGIDEKEPYFELLDIKYPSGEVPSETDFEIKFNLKNSGGGEAKKVKVSVDGGGEIVSKSLSVRNLGTMEPGDQKSLSFTMFADADAKRKNHPVAINIEYEEPDGSSEKTVQHIGVFVEGGGEGRAKIIVEDYSFENEYVKAGEPFDLTLTLTNTNAHESVEDVKISLKSENAIFTPVGSSNSFVVDRLSPKESTQKSIRLKSKTDAEHKTYEINVEMEYGEDLEGEPYVSKEIITIPVIHETDLEIADIQLPPEVNVGRGNDIYVDFYNRGKSKISNMMVTVEGDFKVQEGKYFVGDFEAGSSDYFEASIEPAEVGEFSGKIVFEFEDAIGEKQRVEKEFTINAEEPPAEEDMIQAQMEEPEGGKKGAIAATLLTAAAAAAFLVIKKKRKAKKAKELEEDE